MKLQRTLAGGLTLLCMLCLCHCTQDAGKSEGDKHSIPFIRTNDFERLNLRGKVKSIYQESGILKEINDSLVKEKSLSYNIQEFSENGYLVLEKFKIIDCSSITRYTYDSLDNLLERTERNVNDIYSSDSVYTSFASDSNGRIIKEVISHWDESYFSKKWRENALKRKRIRTKYDDEKRAKLEKTFLSGFTGELDSYCEYESHLDDSGRVEEKRCHDKDGTLMLILKRRFNNKDLLIEEVELKGDSTFISRWQLSYNDMNDLETQQEYNKKGVLVKSTLNSYEYDTVGNWILKLTYKNDAPYSYEVRELEYLRGE